MASYATLDAHSRNCSACIRQRAEQGPGPRKLGHAHHHHAHKKASLPSGRGGGDTGDTKQDTKPLSRSSSVSLVRRSNSCLSSSSLASSCREEAEPGATYLTPTQRKNQEIRRVRLELERANNLLLAKDREITILKKEVAALKESQHPSSLQDSWTADTESAADSGNCEEVDPAWDTAGDTAGAEQPPEARLEESLATTKLETDNIDFELMESALREEEEYRHQLEEDNQELRDQVAGAREELRRLQEARAEEVARLRTLHAEEVLAARRESQQKVEELIIELAESSMRCARQQDAIEQRQARIEQLSREAADTRDTLTRRQEVEQEHTTKDTTPNTKDTSEQYLNINQSSSKHMEHMSSQTTELTLAHASAQTEPGLKPRQVEAGVGTEPSTWQPAHTVKRGTEPRDNSDSSDNSLHYTYQFLRRSIYYYITDKDNRAYHLKSIQRLLEFSEAELVSIHQAGTTTRPPIQPLKRY